MQREVAEDRGVVHPAREHAGGPCGVRGALCDVGVARVAADHRGPRMLVGVEVEDHDVAVLRQALHDGTTDALPAAGDDVGQLPVRWVVMRVAFGAREA